jgi:hypothetical protein
MHAQTSGEIDTGFGHTGLIGHSLLLNETQIRAYYTLGSLANMGMNRKVPGQQRHGKEK